MSPTIRSKGGLPLLVGGQMVAGSQTCCCENPPPPGMCWCPDTCSYFIELVEPSVLAVKHGPYACSGFPASSRVTTDSLITDLLSFEVVGQEDFPTSFNESSSVASNIGNQVVATVDNRVNGFQVDIPGGANRFFSQADAQVGVGCLQLPGEEPRYFARVSVSARARFYFGSPVTGFYTAGFWGRAYYKEFELPSSCFLSPDRSCFPLNQKFFHISTPLTITLSGDGTCSLGDLDMVANDNGTNPPEPTPPDFPYAIDAVDAILGGISYTFRITSRPSCRNCTTTVERSGTAGTTTNTHTFSSAPQCIWFEGYDARYTVKVGGVVAYDSETEVAYASRCISKPDGETEVEVTVDASGEWRYTFCDSCPPVFTSQPCCKRRRALSCEDVEIRQCISAGSLVDSIYYDPEELVCPNAEDAQTCPDGTCTENGTQPALSAPYDCLNGSFQGGAWVRVAGWSAYTEEDRNELTEDSLAVITFIESKVNQTFFVPFDCFGDGGITLNLGPGETYGGVDCSGSNFLVSVAVNLCSRSASVIPSFAGCYGGPGLYIDLGDLNPITVPCNSWTGCNCEGYSSTIPVVFSTGGGTMTVFSS